MNTKNIKKYLPLTAVAGAALWLINRGKTVNGVGAALPQYTVRARLVDKFDKRYSTYGNPSYGVLLETEDGEYMRGRTAPNAQLGYVMYGNYYLERTFNTWTYTDGKRGLVFHSVDKYHD